MVSRTIDDIPNQPPDYAMLHYLPQHTFSHAHIQLLRATSNLKDYVLAKILHLTPKTFAKNTEASGTIKKKRKSIF